jgi:hypothetical protein
MKVLAKKSSVCPLAQRRNVDIGQFNAGDISNEVSKRAFLTTFDTTRESA